MGNYFSRGEGKDTPSTSAFLTFPGPVEKKQARKVDNRCDESTAAAFKKFGWVLAVQVDQRYRDRSNNASTRSKAAGSKAAGSNMKYRAFVVRSNSKSAPHRYRVKIYYNGNHSVEEARAVATFVAIGVGSNDFSIVTADD